MKQKILLGVLVTSIFLTFFSVNVSASEEETTTTSSIVEETFESEELTTSYYNYFIKRGTGDTECYIVIANIEPFTNNVIDLTSKYYPKYYGTYNTIEEAKQALKNGTISKCNSSSMTCMAPELELSLVIYSSHDVKYTCGSFMQAPLTELTQVIPTVGQMTPQQIVQATMKQKVYLLPFLIVSVVGFLAFRKGLAMLFRTLGKA